MVLVAERTDPFNFLSQAVGTQEFAQAELVRSFKRAEASLNSLGAARPADWEFRVNQGYKLALAEIDFLKANVLGKTGNPEAEDKLFSLWGDVVKKIFDMTRNKPTVLAQLKDRALLAATDFWRGVEETRQTFSRWAVTKARPALEKYHSAVRHLNALKRDLAAAKASNEYTPSQIAEHERQIAGAESKLNMVRSAFAKVSGGLSLDKIATEEFGPLSGPIAIVAIAFAILVIAPLIVAAAKALHEIRPLIARGHEAVQKVSVLATVAVVLGVAVAGALVYFLIVRAQK